MPYTPDPTDGTAPLDTEEARTAAAEFRTLKDYIQENIRKLPIVDQDGEASPLITQQGMCIDLDGDIEIPAALFDTGHVLTFYNRSQSVARTIAEGSGLTMYLAGTIDTGDRTLAVNGVATILFLPTADTCVITGMGLT